MDISVVVPAFNEVESIPELHRELSGALDKLGLAWEIFFVDDGSTDGTERVLEDLLRIDDRCHAIRFPINRGKSAAYAAGFASAGGVVVVTLDSDLQDDPAELSKLLDRLEAGADLVVGWKQGRLRNEATKTVPSRIYNGLKRLLFGLDLHDSNCGFRAMRGSVARSLVLYGGQYRLLPELAHLGGFRVEEVPVAHRPRRYGASKYGVSRFWTGLLDLFAVRFLTAYVNRPFQFFASLAFVPLVAGAMLEGYVLTMKALGSSFQAHLAAMLTGVLLIVVAVQVLGVGLLGELVRAMAQRGPSGQAHYLVAAPEKRLSRDEPHTRTSPPTKAAPQ